MDRFVLAWIIYIACTILTFETVCIVAPFINSYIYYLAKIVFCLFIGHWIFLFTKGSIFKKHISSDKKAVFITGCDSGFGFRLAKRLDSQGYHVFAGCLFPGSGGAAELKSVCSSRFCVLHLDVRQDDSVQNAKEFVERNLGDCKLWAVVNNAGVYKGLSVEFSPISDFVDTIQVNTLGQVRMTKAFLPLLRKSKGRIINVNSLAGRGALPFMSCYTMSKSASIAFTECLCREIDTSGVTVISIEPEFFRTPLNDSLNLKKQLERTKAKMEEVFESSSGKKHFKQMKLLFTILDKITSTKLHNVINNMEAAVSMQHPCRVYQPTGNFLRKILLYCITQLPDHIIDTFVRIFFALESLYSVLMCFLFI